MIFKTINNINIYYEIHGAGEPLMLVAGLGSDLQSWLPVIDEFSRHFQLIILDNRGTGRTIPQEVDTSIGQMADDCVALARYLGLSSFNLLGHSMGGFIALDIAGRYPTVVDNLILAATSASNTKRNLSLFAHWALTLESEMDRTTWFRSLFYWLFTKTFFENEEVVEGAIRYGVDYPYPQSTVAFRKQVEAISDFDYDELLSTITAKTLVVSGQDDIIFPVAVSASLAEKIPNATLAVIEDAAHSIHMEQPLAFSTLVSNFLGPNHR